MPTMIKTPKSLGAYKTVSEEGSKGFPYVEHSDGDSEEFRYINKNDEYSREIGYIKNSNDDPKEFRYIAENH